MNTPVQHIARAIESYGLRPTGIEAEIKVDTVLVPEQCMRLYIEGQLYHVTIEALKRCPCCGSTNPHTHERDGYTGLCDNCECL